MRIPWGPLLRAAAYVALLLGIGDVALYRVPIEDGLALFGEYGRMEQIQVVFLGVGLLVVVLTALQRPASRPATVLLAGLLVAVLVREHNNFFNDHGFHGLWELLVTVVVLVTLAVAWRWRTTLGSSVDLVVSRPAFGWMAAGVVVIVFAQLLDERALWQLVLEQEDFPYAVRRMGEETLEAVAYYLFAVGLLELRLTLPRAGAS